VPLYHLVTLAAREPERRYDTLVNVAVVPPVPPRLQQDGRRFTTVSKPAFGARLGVEVTATAALATPMTHAPTTPEMATANREIAHLQPARSAGGEGG